VSVDRGRRRLLGGLGLAGLGLLGSGCEALELVELLRPVQPESRRIGALLTVSPIWPPLLIDVSSDLAVIEGKQLEAGRNYLWGLAESPAELAELAAAQVRAGASLLLAVGTPAIQAAAAATSRLPIVAVQTGDGPDPGPVERLARPGGNVTGAVAALERQPERQLERFRQARPEAARVGLLWRPDSTWPAETPARLAAAADQLGLELEPFEFRAGPELEQAVAAAGRADLGGLLLLPEWQTSRHFLRLAELSASARLPLIAPYRRCTQLGALLSVGPSLPLLGRAAAQRLARLLDGAPPGSLPLERVEETEFALNPLAAQRAGFSLPPELLREAMEVVEREL
jgi:putative ABC transport system substrate-binding protein